MRKFFAEFQCYQCKHKWRAERPHVGTADCPNCLTILPEPEGAVYKMPPQTEARSRNWDPHDPNFDPRYAQYVAEQEAQYQAEAELDQEMAEQAYYARKRAEAELRDRTSQDPD